MTNSLLLCCAIGDLNKICNLRFQTKLVEKCLDSLLGTFGILHLSLFGTSYPMTLYQPYFAFFLRFFMFSFNKLILDDFSN